MSISNKIRGEKVGVFDLIGFDRQVYDQILGQLIGKHGRYQDSVEAAKPKLKKRRLRKFESIAYALSTELRHNPNGSIAFSLDNVIYKISQDYSISAEKDEKTISAEKDEKTISAEKDEKMPNEASIKGIIRILFTQLEVTQKSGDGIIRHKCSVRYDEGKNAPEYGYVLLMNRRTQI